ncbi:MAG: hypothetical protein ACRESZ_11075, partial [Methylococcales bacterium]
MTTYYAKRRHNAARPEKLTEPSNRVVLSVRSLKTRFGPAQNPLRAVNGIDFEIRSNETFALIGESGSGKTIAALSVLRLLPPGARIEQG